ncbi:MAG: hypothetical protein I3273_06955 [Candidatus Moeniiplasma glomeromycotorum]|nr:hypothetical protein [Candidatus Moeniiplasma glomeromycotorum]MCE8168266.1 hypothetical protein [Candidatus Moeniiplasma glomeromycotorum]MCE8169825.1 hypothetical protein [Candidatus Moeniiplasma glomeromycotorum]
MWQKFKDYLAKKGKSSINKQELDQEIKNLSQQEKETQKPTSKTPIILGGVTIAVVLGIIAVLAIRERKKIRVWIKRKKAN